MQAVTIVHTSEQALTLEWVSSVSNDMIADSVLALLCGIDSNYATIKRASRDVCCARCLTRNAKTHPLVTSKACGHTHGDGESVEVPSHPHPHSLAAKRKAVSTDEKLPSAKTTPAIMTDIQLLRKFLIAHFGNVSELVTEELEGKEDELLLLRVEVDEHEATIDLMTMVRYFIVHPFHLFPPSLLLGRDMQEPCAAKTYSLGPSDGADNNQQPRIEFPLDIVLSREIGKVARIYGANR